MVEVIMPYRNGEQQVEEDCQKNPENAHGAVGRGQTTPGARENDLKGRIFDVNQLFAFSM
jgi:hypothetical protein